MFLSTCVFSISFVYLIIQSRVLKLFAFRHVQVDTSVHRGLPEQAPERAFHI